MINFLNKTKLIYKSVLDLIPAILVAILVVILSGYGMNNIYKKYESILENDLKMVVDLVFAKVKLDQYRDTVSREFYIATQQSNLDLLLKAQEQASNWKRNFLKLLNQIDERAKNHPQFIDVSDNSSSTNELTEKEEFVKYIFQNSKIIKSLFEKNISEKERFLGYLSKEIINRNVDGLMARKSLTLKKEQINELLGKTLKASSKMVNYTSDNNFPEYYPEFSSKIQSYNYYLSDLLLRVLDLYKTEYNYFSFSNFEDANIVKGYIITSSELDEISFRFSADIKKLNSYFKILKNKEKELKKMSDIVLEDRENKIYNNGKSFNDFKDTDKQFKKLLSDNLNTSEKLILFLNSYKFSVRNFFQNQVPHPNSLNLLLSNLHKNNESFVVYKIGKMRIVLV